MALKRTVITEKKKKVALPLHSVLYIVFIVKILSISSSIEILQTRSLEHYTKYSISISLTFPQKENHHSNCH